MMSNQDDFNHAYAVMRDNDEFNSHCDEHDIEEFQRKYIVVSAMNPRLNEKEKCEIIDIKYNFRPHQKCKSDRDHDTHARVFYLTAKCLTNDDEPEQERETLDEVLAGIIYNPHTRDTDKVKAVESLLKYRTNQEGSQVLKPWERLWNDTIIPNMV